jgi:sugar/nucleoside kinase (ribokinase family)
VVIDPDLKTGLSVILSRGDDRAILTYGGSISELRFTDIDLNWLARARHLHIASFYMLDRLRPDILRLLAKAHGHGLTTSLDSNYDPSEQWQGGLQAALEATDIFFPNRAELLAISGEHSVDAALAKLASGGHIVAAKLGAQGSVARQGARQVAASALALQPVDTTGAGDSFDAGFIYAYLNGWDLAQALRLACVCGSLSTRAAGGVEAQATIEEARRFLE